MKTGILLSAVLACMVAGCDYLPTEENEAKNAVKAVLFDPDSAKFSGIRKGRRAGVWCGLVNAKNKMGGYVGNKGFAYRGAPGGGDVDFAPEEDAPTQEEFEKFFMDLYTGEGGVTDSHSKLSDRCFKAKVFDGLCGPESSPKKFAKSCNLFFDEEKNLVEQWKDWKKEKGLK